MAASHKRRSRTVTSTFPKEAGAAHEKVICEYYESALARQRPPPQKQEDPVLKVQRFPPNGEGFVVFFFCLLPLVYLLIYLLLCKALQEAF